MNILGIVVGFLFMLGGIGLGTLLLKLRVVQPLTSRKIIHIAVSHWWLVAIPFFDSVWAALVTPVAFIAINYAALKLKFFTAMDDPSRPHNFGTVYFPISLSILVALCWGGVLPYTVGGAAMLVLGWSDGLAAIIGRATRFGEFKLFGRPKSVAGILTMLAASVVVLLLFNVSIATVVWLAPLVTLVELFTPLGLDNLTVPATVALVLGVI